MKNKEEIEQYLLDGKLDATLALEKILAEEYRSATLEIINEIPDITEEQKINILNFNWIGHTVLEWELLAREAKGFNGAMNIPNWYEPHSKMIDALTYAKLLYLTEKQLK